jgi:LAS superfamily LD-carboxypeptidase LdcB
MNIDALLGLTSDHLTTIEGTKHSVHSQMISDYLKLQKAAFSAGFDLQIISSFRSRERQLKIWNDKVNGLRPIFDESGSELNPKQLSPSDLMYSILRWSALPGASRHHWGTDIDVFNANTQAEKEVKLTPSETDEGGPAAELHHWLDSHLHEYGFFRPYQTDQGGVSPERWHISYHPLSRRMLDNYSFSLFKRNISEIQIELKDTILENADLIFNKYFLNIDQP